MFTEIEARALMALVHAVIIWQVSTDDPRDYEAASERLHEAAGALDQATIQKLVATINMKTMRATG